MKRPGIYLIRIYDAFYVGHSSDTGQRFRQHRNRLRSGTHVNPILQNAWRKHGPQSFQFLHLKTIEDHKERCAAEILLIAAFRSKGRSVYNIGDGGEGQAHTIESRAKLSSIHKGKKLSEETRQRMSQSLKGIPCHPNTKEASRKYWTGRKRGPMSDETKKRISIAKIGKPSHPWSEKSKQKVRDSLRGRKATYESRKRMSESRKAAISRGQRSRIKLITYNGETHSIKEWAEIKGIERRNLGYRLGRGGWPVELALNTPVRVL